MEKFKNFLNVILNGYFYKYFLGEVTLIYICLIIWLLNSNKINNATLNGEDLEIICFITVFVGSCVMEIWNIHKLTNHFLNIHIPLFKSIFFYKIRKFYCSLVINHIEIVAFVLGEIYASSPSSSGPTNPIVFTNGLVIIFLVIPISFTIFTIMDKNNKEALLCDPDLYDSTLHDLNDYSLNLKRIKYILSLQKSEIIRYDNQRKDIIERINRIIRDFR